MTYCYVCPHRCGVDRPESIHDTNGTFGSCRVGMLPMVSRAAPHLWEEPVISGTDGKGSGAVFFTGCNLHCVFCQNYDITTRMIGKEITVERLKEIYHELIAKGVHNINLVTPTHFTEAVLKSLDEPLPVPVVYNTSGFETVDTLRRLEGKVQIWLPDLKWSDDQASIKYSNAWNYWKIAREAILEMYRQVGPYEIGEDGLLKKGVLIRHLIMPGFVENSKAIIDWVSETFKPGQVLFSLMHQYIPCGMAAKYPEINRKVTDEEYKEVQDYLFASNIEDGFVQEGEAASGEFVPKWDLTGVEKA
ncbi:MAG: radical SAM protein [Succiniclasticum sp.]|jgi:putative pyruvate formate lyase activating enzyme